jgi:hypothetical protein
MRTLALLLALSVASFEAPAQLYKCVQDGKTVYQQERCPETAKQSTVRGADPVPERPLDPKAAEEKAGKATATEIDGLIDTISGFTVCAEQVEDFATKYGPAFEDWKSRNAAGFAKFSASPDASGKLNARLAADRAKPFADDSSGRAAKSAHCARVLATIQPGHGSK